MKKLLIMAAFFAASVSLFAGCDDDDPEDKMPAVPAITLEDADIDAVHEIVAGIKVKVIVTAPGAIADFAIKIESPVLSEALLGSLGLSTEMNLVSATGAMASGLSGLGFPVGDKVKDQTALSFDISQLIPLIAQLPPQQTSNHNFELTVTDAKGQTTTKTLKFHLTGTSDVTYNNDADLWANTASLTVKLAEAGTPTVEYKRKTASDWQIATVTANPDGTYKAVLEPKWVAADNHKSGAKQFTLDNNAGVFAGATYDYRVSVDGEAVEGLSGTFDTPAGAEITGGDMEKWSKSYDYLDSSIRGDMSEDEAKECAVYYPNASSERAAGFWANGNNMLTPALCNPDTLANKTFAAKLKGVNAFITFAAGNLFTGVFDFVSTDIDPLTGFARFGQKYEFTARPSAMKVRYKAKITTYTFISGLKEDLTSEMIGKEIDKARIFVCITDWKDRHSVRSGMGAMMDGSAEKINGFDPEVQAVTDEGKVLAYGSKWIDASTAGDEWVELVIPILYKEDARTAKPDAKNYSLVISTAASAYGDYLSGSWDNELYLDDFEWVY